MSFIFTPHSQMPAVILIDYTRQEDHRGSFAESYRADEFLAHGIPLMVQENRSESVSYTLRGLHYQLNPRAQGKLVSCVKGAILDVAVDIRRNSTTYGQSVAVPLSDVGDRMLYIPPGFAHGFVVGPEYPYSATVVYKVTEYFSAEHDRGIRWDDSTLNISWGLLLGERDKLKISYKDRIAPLLQDAENNFYGL